MSRRMFGVYSAGSLKTVASELTKYNVRQIFIDCEDAYC